MRDPRRISLIINELQNLWYNVPDLRLGQLLLDIVPDSNLLFYIEDDELINKIRDAKEKLLKEYING